MNSMFGCSLAPQLVVMETTGLQWEVWSETVFVLSGDECLFLYLTVSAPGGPDYVLDSQVKHTFSSVPPSMQSWSTLEESVDECAPSAVFHWWGVQGPAGPRDLWPTLCEPAQSVLLRLVILICCSAGISCVEEQKKTELFVFLQRLRQQHVVDFRDQHGSAHLHHTSSSSSQIRLTQTLRTVFKVPHDQKHFSRETRDSGTWSCSGLVQSNRTAFHRS